MRQVFAKTVTNVLSKYCLVSHGQTADFYRVLLLAIQAPVKYNLSILALITRYLHQGWNWITITDLEDPLTWIVMWVRLDVTQFNPLRLILRIFMHTLFTKSHYSGFCTCMRLMLRILYKKYPAQTWISPFCSAEEGLSFAINIFCFGLSFAIDSSVYYGRVWFLEYRSDKPAMGKIWDNKRCLNNILLYCRYMYNE